MPMDRREFLRAAAAGTTGMWMADRLAEAAPGPPESGPRVPLGRGLKVTRLGFGTGMTGGNRHSNQTRLGPEKFERLLQYAYDQNVRLFDMADMYGTHGYVGQALRQAPRQLYPGDEDLAPSGRPAGARAADADVCVAVSQGVRHRLL